MNKSRPQPLRAWTRIPPFLPVPVRTRADCWTPVRQADFIGFLAETGSVTHAAAEVGKSRASAYKLRGLPGAESFVAAWDAACGQIPAERKLTFAELQEWAFLGPFTIRFSRGRYYAAARKPNATALLRVLSRLDRSRVAAGDTGW